MFMFRSRKTNLVKRAWKARKVGLAHDDQYHHQLRQLQREAEQELKGHAMHQLRSLTESQLELLVASLESGGGKIGECVLLPRNGGGGAGGGVEVGAPAAAGEQQQHLNGGESVVPPPPPHLLMMWLWRWPDLFHQQQQQLQGHQTSYEKEVPTNAALIQSLPCCAARNDHVYVCANPYHWARVILTGSWIHPPHIRSESPPPPYSRFNVDLLRPEDAAPSEDSYPPESLETGGTYQYSSYSNNGHGTNPWCQIAYWEGRDRVDKLCPVRKSSFYVIGDPKYKDGHAQDDVLCITSLSKGDNYTSPEQSKKIKEKIGLGFVLYQERGGVSMYNRSKIPLYVCSPTLDGGIRSRYKLHPGHFINIFDYDTARLYQRLPGHPDVMGPIDPNSVKISFAKGWGNNYHRRDIISCPCWLEILLEPVR